MQKTTKAASKLWLFAMLSALVVLMALVITGCAAPAASTEEESESTEPTTEAETAEETTADDEDATDETADGKTLVAYFSGTGNTARVALMIGEATGAEVYEIQAAQPYTQDELSSDGYYGDNRPYNESQDSSIRPEISSGPVPNAASYSRVFLGYPIWYGAAPDIIYTFLDENDFSQAEIYPFCTSGSSDIAQSENLLKSLYPALHWMPGERFSSSTTREQVDAWLQSLS